MGIGASIILIAAGAILTFAVDYRITSVNIPVIGIVLMVVGGVGLIISLFLNAPRRRSERTVTTYDDTAYPAADGRHVERTHEYRDSY